MPKDIPYKKNIDPLKAAKVKMTADIHRVSTRQVYRVIEGRQKNEKIIDVYMQLDEGINLLIEAVKKEVPFN
jgi:response regulator of citrate/malate metabolism